METNQPTAGLILGRAERDHLLHKSPKAARFIRRYYGSQEFIKGIERWCIWIEDAELRLALSIPEVAERIEGVRQSVLRARQLQLWTPQLRHIVSFKFNTRARGYERPRSIFRNKAYIRRLASSGRDAIINNRAFAIYDPAMFEFSILSSRMHCVWTMRSPVGLRRG